jgi:hypothetical protein
VKGTPLLLTLVFFLLIAGGITLYQYFPGKKETTVWDLIPSQTVLVFEADDCSECNYRPERSIIRSMLNSLLFDFPDSTKKHLAILSSPKKGNAISLHVTSKDDFDVVYYFPGTHGKQFESALNSWKELKNVKFSERELNGVKIQEFNFENRKFSCVQLDHVWVGSFTPFLMEDVIRTFTSDDKSTFTNEIADVYSLPRIKGDPGNIFVHLKNFTSWLKIFPDDASSFSNLGQASLLDVKNSEHSITLNGFSLTRKGDESLLSYFEHQSPVQFDLKRYISNRTIFAIDYGISDGSTLYKSLSLSKNKNVQDTLASLARVDFAKLFSSVGKEMSACYLESRNGAVSKILLFDTDKPQEWLSAFDQFSKAVEKEDTVFYEKYSTYEIREIEMNNFPGKVFHPLTSGFAQTYYTSIGNTIILSEQLEEIKQFVSDIDEENVWGKSVSFNKFLESTLLESNVSMYVNTPIAWNFLSHRLSPRWKNFIAANQPLLNAIELGAIQFGHLNESFYTNVTWTYSNEIVPTDQKGKKSDRLVTSLSASIISEPMIIRSHVNKNEEILVQDSLFNLYHFSSEGKILWQKTLDGPIIGDVKQVDFFKNGKLQHFFATPKKLHVIDRLGNYVSPFPADIRTKELEFLSVVDYDNSKSYRFLLADKSGKLWMYDKEMQNLEGWKPLNIDGGLFTQARHHRIRGKDYMLAIRKDGRAYLMNRRGEFVKGFPLDLDARPAGDYFLEVGNSIATTNFTCISRDGFRIKFSLDGKLLSREALVKPSFETQFSLITEHHGKSYLIKRQDANRLTLLTDEGVELVSNGFVGTSPVAIKYYDFGAGKIFISITDISQDVSFIYDGKGKLLNQTPIEGRAIQVRPGTSDFPKTYIVNGNTLIIQ